MAIPLENGPVDLGVLRAKVNKLINEINAAIAGGGGGGSPGSPDGSVQYNNSGAFGGSSATFDGVKTYTFSGANLNMLLGPLTDGGSAGYSGLSLNGTLDGTAMTGVVGGLTGDDSLYLLFGGKTLTFDNVALALSPSGPLDLGQVSTPFRGGFFQGQITSTYTSITALGAAVATSQSGGGSYDVGDVLTPTTGTGTKPTFTITDLQVVGNPVINAVGSGGTPGLTTFTSTDGTGTAFTFTGTIQGDGTLTGQTLTRVTGGDFTVRPADLTAVAFTGGSLVGGTVSVKTGPLLVTATTPGDLTVQSADPTVTTVSPNVGTGATLHVGWNYAPAIVGSDAASGFGFANGEPELNLGGLTARLEASSPLNATKSLVIRGNNGDNGIGFEIVPSGDSREYVTAYIVSYGDISSLTLGTGNGTPNNPLSITNGTQLSALYFAGQDNTFGGLNPTVQIVANATEDWGGGNNGTSISIATASNGTSGTAYRLVIDGSGNLQQENGLFVTVDAHTVSGANPLPAPSAGIKGARTYVTDALAPVFGAPVANGGAVTIPVFCDGTNWIVG